MVYDNVLMMLEYLSDEYGNRNNKPPAPCGTMPGYNRHLRLGEVTCAECRGAKRDENHKRRRVA